MIVERLLSFLVRDGDEVSDGIVFEDDFEGNSELSFRIFDLFVLNISLAA